MLTVRDVTLRYSGAFGREVLRGVSFDLARDETLAVVGPSGRGKTTLLYLLCGLLRPGPGGGEIRLDGAPVYRPRPDVAIILQDYGLLPWKTVLSNVALGLKVQGVPRRERRERARQALAQVGLVERAADYPSRLSGGEQQRVAIARAYAQRPRLLLMDEPFSSLDAITREKLQNMLLETWRESRTPWVLVTHSVEEAVFLGRRIVVLAGTPATIVASFENPAFGDPGLRDRPACFELARELRKTMGVHW